jgi:hypothetical protein
MNRKPICPCVLLSMVATALVLLIGLAVILGLGRLIAAMGDSGGAAVLDWIALAGAVVLVVDLIGLVLALGVNSLDQPLGEPDEPPEEP